MKRQSNNKFQGTKFQAVPKHQNTFAFHPGNTVETPAMPAYNTHGTQYQRILPPVRNQQILNCRLLSYLINSKTCANTAEVTDNGIKLNHVDVTVNEGITIAAGTKFRFKDVWDFMRFLMQEGIFHGDMHDVRVIRESYFKADE
jgi:hypothetical protein